MSLTAPRPSVSSETSAPIDTAASLAVTDGARPVLSAPGRGDFRFPPSASARALLRRGLPAIYQNPTDGFVMRFLEALEQVLDPLVAVIDCRASYLAPDLAPDDMVEEMARWLGLEPHELPAGTASEVLKHAPYIARWRGTRKGLEMVLDCCFPRLGLRVHDGGGVLSPSDPVRDDGGGELVVSCDKALGSEQWMEIERIIERQLPLFLRPHLDRRYLPDAPEARHE